jgi:hypothetical protein
MTFCTDYRGFGMYLSGFYGVLVGVGFGQHGTVSVCVTKQPVGFAVYPRPCNSLSWCGGNCG